eukprot:TRINITY_DN26563_c0_g2_i1.p1 TRINITY_DN26563_c0_g2~~TRINITY_DN26563_c0_g2_i1.p1  ORF type:complete len:499 (+),score=118.84 TRINITY_DN26563_c0_g2_i1:162-1658(+)
MPAVSVLCRCMRGLDLLCEDEKLGGSDFDSLFFSPSEAAGVPGVPCLEPTAVAQLSSPNVQCPEGLLTYSTLLDQPLRGAPVLEGDLWWLMAEDTVESVQFSLYVNGFSFVHAGRKSSISFSPFALVRNCKFLPSTVAANVAVGDMKIFKVALFSQGVCYYFGVKGSDARPAEEERATWVLEIARAMNAVTESVFPPFGFCCAPLPLVPSTRTRLMAGYVVYRETATVASVLYCELHPHGDGQARMAFYENVMCKKRIMDIYITENTVCCEKAGIRSSCFSIDCHTFASRNFGERKLWLRAISNVKVKLQNRAPPPTEEELWNYRRAIEEHVDYSGITPDGRVRPVDALLQRFTLPCLDAAGAGDFPVDERNLCAGDHCDEVADERHMVPAGATEVVLFEPRSPRESEPAASPGGSELSRPPPRAAAAAVVPGQERLPDVLAEKPRVVGDGGGGDASDAAAGSGGGADDAAGACDAGSAVAAEGVAADIAYAEAAGRL